MIVRLQRFTSFTMATTIDPSQHTYQICMAMILDGNSCTFCVTKNAVVEVPDTILPMYCGRLLKDAVIGAHRAKLANIKNHVARIIYSSVLYERKMVQHNRVARQTLDMVVNITWVWVINQPHGFELGNLVGVILMDYVRDTFSPKVTGLKGV